MAVKAKGAITGYAMGNGTFQVKVEAIVDDNNSGELLTEELSFSSGTTTINNAVRDTIKEFAEGQGETFGMLDTVEIVNPVNLLNL